MTRYTDGDALGHEGRVDSSPILSTTMTSHSPVSSPSWDISSESSVESGLVPDVPPAESIPEQIGFGGMYYEHIRHSHYHYQPRWDFKFPDPGHGHSASSRTLEHSADFPVVSNPQLVGSRGEFTTRHLSGPGVDEISYTDEANTKISNRLRRRCFNCKATETSTWRRSVLSPGKLVGHQGYLTELDHLIHPQLCNKCGLFERTHAIPRPKKFPRRRTHGTKVIRPPSHPDMRALSGSYVNRHSKDIEPPSLPVTSHLHALDPLSGEIIPQHTPWNSPEPPARASRCYATTDQPAVYHPSGQFPPTALPGAIWI
jgi:hypothetical protein